MKPKKRTRELIAYFIIGVIPYTAIAFINWEHDPRYWGEAYRAVCALLSFSIIGIAMVIEKDL